jgi:hypothetical protein
MNSGLLPPEATKTNQWEAAMAVMLVKDRVIRIIEAKEAGKTKGAMALREPIPPVWDLRADTARVSVTREVTELSVVSPEEAHTMRSMDPSGEVTREPTVGALTTKIKTPTGVTEAGKTGKANKIMTKETRTKTVVFSRE